MTYSSLFHELHPHFFEKTYIRALPVENISSEQILPLAAFDPAALSIEVPDGIRFGMAPDSMSAIHEAVRQVEEDWVQYFNRHDRVFCAFDGDRIVAFCILDDFGTGQGRRFGGPGCVGTIPEYRCKGIGLKMVQEGTAILKQQGYDFSYIHYTHLDRWYAKLGYETIVRWNSQGIVWEKEDASLLLTRA